MFLDSTKTLARYSDNIFHFSVRWSCSYISFGMLYLTDKRKPNQRMGDSGEVKKKKERETVAGWRTTVELYLMLLCFTCPLVHRKFELLPACSWPQFASSPVEERWNSTELVYSSTLWQSLPDRFFDSWSCVASFGFYCEDTISLNMYTVNLKRKKVLEGVLIS